MGPIWLLVSRPAAEVHTIVVGLQAASAFVLRVGPVFQWVGGHVVVGRLVVGVAGGVGVAPRALSVSDDRIRDVGLGFLVLLCCRPSPLGGAAPGGGFV